MKAFVATVRWGGKLESASNARGHTRARARGVAEVRSYARLMVRPLVGRWVEPDPTKAEKARRRATERVLGKRVASYQLDAVRLTTALVVTMTRVAPRTLDVGDNLNGAFKAVRDGIADVLGSDDRNPLIEWRYAQRKGAPKSCAGGVTRPAEYAVEITITERGTTSQETSHGAE